MAQIPNAVATPGQVGIAEPEPARTRVLGLENPVPQAIDRATQLTAGVAQDFQNLQDKKNLLDYSSAQSSFLQEKVKLDEKYAQDPDFATAPDRYQADLKKLGDQFGGTIQDPTLRNEFNARVVIPQASSGWQQLYKVGKAREADTGVATLNQTIQTNLDAAWRANDEPTRQQLLKATNLSIDAALAHGWITATDAQAVKQKTGEDYLEGLLKVTAARDGPRAAYALLAGPGSGHPAAALAPNVEDEITQAAGSTGQDPQKGIRFAQIESSGDPHAPNGGLFQVQGAMAKDFKAKYGVDPQDATVEQQIEFFHDTSPKVDAAFTQIMGRAPTAQESYLAWQQGASGAAALLQNPDKSAIETLTPFYAKQYGARQGAAYAQAAILGNVAPGFRKAALNWTGKQFADYWRTRYDNTGASSADTGTQGSAGTAVRIATPDGGWPSAKGMAALNLTPQEQNLYQHHIDNMENGKAVQNPDGSISTLLQMSVEHDGKFYNIPSVWDGQELSPKEAVARAAAEGWNKWPSYDSEQAAEARYGQMHDALEGDIGATSPTNATTTGAMPGATFNLTGSPFDMMPPDRRAELLQAYDREIKAADAEAQRNAAAGQLEAQTVINARVNDDLQSLEDTGKPASGSGVTVSEMLAAGMKAPEIARVQGGYARASQLYTAKTQVALAGPDEEQALVTKFTPSGPGYADQRPAYEAIIAAIQAKHQELATDPAGYAVKASPDLATSFDAAIKDPTKFGGYVQKLDATFDRLGVPVGARTYLPKQSAQALTQSIIGAPAPDRANALVSMAQRFGPDFDKVLGSMVKDGGLPVGYEMITAIGDPTARTMLADALADPKKTRDALATGGAGGKAMATQIDEAIADNDGMNQLRSSFGYASGGAMKADEIQNTVQLLAYRYALTGMDAQSAADKAVATLTSEKYDFIGTTRVPAGQSDMAASTMARIQQGIKASDLQPVVNAGLDPKLTKADLQDLALKNAQKGHWATTPDDQGLQLMGYDGRPVQRADGSLVQFRFADMANGTATAGLPLAQPNPGKRGFRGLPTVP